MRHPGVALVVTVAHLLLFAWALHPDWVRSHLRWPSTPRPAAAPAQPAEVPPTPKRPEPPRPAAPSAPGAAAAPTPDASTWLRQQDVARRQYAERRYGRRIADLLAAADAGTTELEQLARDGDDRAFDARNWRIDECQTLATPAPDPADVERTARERGQGLDADQARFLHDVLAARAEHKNEQRLVCAKVNTDANLVEQAYVDLAANATPLARLAALELRYERDADLEALIAGLRELARSAPDAPIRLALATRLLESLDDAQRAEGLALLRQLAPDDPEALNALAQCVEIGCGAYAPRPGEAAELLERAARLGYGWALEREIVLARQRGDARAALAWSGYRNWLNAHGCYAAPNDLAARFLADDLRLPYELHADAGVLAAAAGDTQALIAASGAAARRRAACD